MSVGLTCLRAAEIDIYVIFYYHDNAFGPQKTVQLRFAIDRDIDSEKRNWNIIQFPALASQCPGVRRFSPPVGQGEKREIKTSRQWKLSAVSTTSSIFSKLSKRIDGNHKKQKSSVIELLMLEKSFSLYWNLDSSSCCATSWNTRDEAHAHETWTFSKQFMNNTLF